MDSRIFISYRRADTSGHAGRLYDRLVATFGKEQVFKDVETLEPGVDFVENIQQAVGSCDVLIALIGDGWLGAVNDKGERRLDQPEDYVRLEVATALERNIRVIPVLVEGASMPHAADLPEPLKKLARRNSLTMSEDAWDFEVQKLITTIERVLGMTEPATTAEAHVEPAGQRSTGVVHPGQGTGQAPMGMEQPLPGPGPFQPVGQWQIASAFGPPDTMEIKPDGSFHLRTSLMGTPMEVTGQWLFNPYNNVLQLQGQYGMMGAMMPYAMALQFQGQQGNLFTAADPMGNMYQLTRIA